MRQESILKFTENLLRIMLRIGVFAIAGVIIITVINPTNIKPAVNFKVEKAGEIVKENTYLGSAINVMLYFFLFQVFTGASI